MAFWICLIFRSPIDSLVISWLFYSLTFRWKIRAVMTYDFKRFVSINKWFFEICRLFLPLFSIFTAKKDVILSFQIIIGYSFLLFFILVPMPKYQYLLTNGIWALLQQIVIIFFCFWSFPNFPFFLLLRRPTITNRTFQ